MRKVYVLALAMILTGCLSHAFVIHRVKLTWNASNTQGVTYKVYRSTVHGGPYTLGLSGVTNLYANDSTVHAGSTYYYVVTAFDGTQESVYSNEVQAVVPTP